MGQKGIVRPMADESDLPEDFERPPSFFPYEDGDSPSSEDYGEPVEVTVEGVYFAESKGDVQRFVLLTDGSRKLPISIGGFEAAAIRYPLEDAKPDRPMTHDLMRGLIERLGGHIERIVIDDIWNKTYYAKIHLRQGNETSEIDCRPSDAIALALRYGSPIYVCDGILDQGFE